jgi:hypothetical protein
LRSSIDGAGGQAGDQLVARERRDDAQVEGLVLAELVGVVDAAARAAVHEGVVRAGEHARGAADDPRVAVGVEQEAEVLGAEDDGAAGVRVGGDLVARAVAAAAALLLLAVVPGVVELAEHDGALAGAEVVAVAQLVLEDAELLDRHALADLGDQAGELLDGARGEGGDAVLLAAAAAVVVEGGHDLDAGRRDEELGVAALDDDALADAQRRGLAGRLGLLRVAAVCSPPSPASMTTLLILAESMTSL